MHASDVFAAFQRTPWSRCALRACPSRPKISPTRSRRPCRSCRCPQQHAAYCQDSHVASLGQIGGLGHARPQVQAVARASRRRVEGPSNLRRLLIYAHRNALLGAVRPTVDQERNRELAALAVHFLQQVCDQNAGVLLLGAWQLPDCALIKGACLCAPCRCSASARAAGCSSTGSTCAPPRCLASVIPPSRPRPTTSPLPSRYVYCGARFTHRQARNARSEGACVLSVGARVLHPPATPTQQTSGLCNAWLQSLCTASQMQQNRSATTVCTPVLFAQRCVHAGV